MVHTTCAALNCLSSSRNKELKFHQFPRRQERCDIWIDKCGRSDFVGRSCEDLRNTYICNLHFETHMYGKKILKKTAYPTLRLAKKALNTVSTQTYFAQQGTSSEPVASSSSVRQNVLPAVTGDADSSCDDDDEADEATTSQQHDNTDQDPLLHTIDIKEELPDPDDEQPMEQDKDPAVENYIFIETEIKKEPVEDVCFENSFSVLSHVPKSSAEAEELKLQLETKTAAVEVYKNEVNELKQRNFVLQDTCEKLTKLLKKSLTKSPCKEIGKEFTEILSRPQENVDTYRKKMQQKESQYKVKIKMLLKTIEESQQLLQAKQKQWEAKENEFLEKIKQLEYNYQQLQQGQVDNQAVQFLEKDNILEEKEREWLEKERKWLEQLEMKETQWLEKERSWQEQVEERDRQISQLQRTRLETFNTNR